MEKTFQSYVHHVVDSCGGDELVTVVRRRIAYEEVVLPRDEFDRLNTDIEEGQGNCYDLYDLDFQSIDFRDFESESEEYVAFPGDVTNFTDDAIGFMFEYQPWKDYGTIEMCHTEG